MLDALALSDTAVIGGFLALVVFGGLRFIDDIVDVFASLGDSSLSEFPDESDSSNP